MAQSPSSTATPTIDHAALARRVVEMLLQGGTIAECASEIGEFGGSMLAVYECLDRGMEPGAIRGIAKLQREARAVRLETLKNAALHELWLMAFGDETPSRGLTADEMRAIEARRRACVSLLQLKPFQNATAARDSVQDVPSPRFFDDGKRNHSRDDCATDEWGTDSATRLAATRPTEGERGGTSNDYSSDELRVANDGYGSSGDEESRSREFVIDEPNDPDATFARDLENVHQLARSINRDERAHAEYVSEDPSPPTPLPSPEYGEGSTPRLTRQQMRKRVRDQRKRGRKKPDGLMSDGSENNGDAQSTDRLETCRYRVNNNRDESSNAERIVDDAHPP